MKKPPGGFGLPPVASYNLFNARSQAGLVVPAIMSRPVCLNMNLTFTR
jgi:hypothetical protein